MKIAICIPTRHNLELGTSFDLANMCAYTARNTDFDIHLLTSAGTLIFDQRNDLALEALKEKCDYVLWIDSDMRFPKDTIQRLLAHDKDIVGVNATTRTKPTKPTAKRLKIEGNTGTWSQVTSKDKTGIEQVTALGCGVMLVKTKVYETLDMPYFWFYKIPGQKILGEDVHFCVKANDFGFDSFIDHDLSQEIGHVGSYTYGWDDI